MKNLMLIFGLTLALQNAHGALSNNQFERLDVDKPEFTFYVGPGVCTLNIMSNIARLWDGHSETRALAANLEVLGARFEFHNRYLALLTDDLICNLPSFGGLITIRTKDGRTLKEVILSIIPSNEYAESTLIAISSK